MTKKIFTSYASFLCMALLLTGVATAEASEVTGTLSSETGSDTQTSGNLGGTVSSGSGGSSGSRGGGGSSNSPAGAVLGASTDNIEAPGFPNAGTRYEVGSVDHSLWSTVKNFFINIFSF